MRNIYLQVLWIFIALLFGTQSVFTQAKPTITVGFLFDGDEAQFEQVRQMLRDDADAILASAYNIRMPANKILPANWSSDTAEQNYQRLMNDPQVDIVVGLGMLSGSIIAKKRPYVKPVIVWGIFDPALQGIPPTAEGTSGVNNLTYLLQNTSLERDLDRFYQVYPYRKVGIAFTEEVFKLYTLGSDQLAPVMNRNKTEFAALPVTNGINDVLNALEGIDAVYVGYLGKFEGAEKNKLIAALNAEGIPTYGLTISEAKAGALAAISPETNFAKGIRRIILNIEAILSGEDAANLPVNLTFEENLTFNMQTAKEINFSPSFAILAEARLINEFAAESERAINLLDVMYEAQQTNLDILIQEAAVLAAEKDVSLARSDYFPSLTLSADGTWIDEDRGKLSGGERQVSGTAALQQLIFSDQVIGNIGIQKQLLHASEYGYDQVRLDVILNAATAYFSILRAKSIRETSRADVDLTRHNLEISKQRESVGYSGRSDVYRWESRLASAQTDFLSAKNNVELAKIRLNQVLNRPQDENFLALDVSLTDTIFRRYSEDEFGQYIENPHSWDILIDFWIDEAIRNSPEVKQLDANIEASNRQLGIFQRQRFIPTIGLGANVDRTFSRGGAGSDIEGIDDNRYPWSVGINANLPLFQGGSVSVNIQQTRINISQLDHQKAQLIQSIEQNVRSAALDLMVGAVNLGNSRKSADFARKSLELVQDLYTNGRASIVDLIDAQNAALDTDLAALNSEYDFLVSILNVERTIGEFGLLRTNEERDLFLQRFREYLDSRLNE